MVEAFIDFSNKPTIMITSRNHIVLYDTLNLDNQFLNKVYQILAAAEPTSVLVVTHAVYSKEKFKNAYEIRQIKVRDDVYTGTLSQLDINKFMYVFNALKIEEVRFCDKFSMYEYYLSSNQCAVDICGGKYLLLSKLDGIDKIDYTSSSNFEMALLQLCRKHNNDNIINFSNFTDYDAVRWFENFVKVADTSAYVTMTVFGFFRFIKPDVSVDLTQVKFNSQLETVTYDTKDNIAKAQELSFEEPIVVNKIDEEPKSEFKIITRLLAALNVLIVILLLTAFGLDYYFTKKVQEPDKELAVLKNQNNHSSLILEKLDEDFVTDKNYIITELKTRCPEECIIASITIDSSIEVVYYVAETQQIDKVIATTQDLLKVNGTSDGGVITMNNINYYKYTVSYSE